MSADNLPPVLSGPLAGSDFYTLVGHAHYLEMQGQDDLPKYFLELAGRIATAIGEKDLAARAAEMHAAMVKKTTVRAAGGQP